MIKQGANFCAHAGAQGMRGRGGGGLRRWNAKAISWANHGVSYPGLDFGTAMGEVSELVARLCGLRIVLRNDGEPANIVSHPWEGDGPGNTLAYQQLPGENTGPRDQLLGRFDSGEDYQDQRTLTRVIFHEVAGHALGLEHHEGSDSIMNPFYNANVEILTDVWLQESLAERYGPPTTQPTPDLEDSPYCSGCVFLRHTPSGTECRYNAPVEVAGRSRPWPEVDPDDWCRNHSPH